MREEEDGLRRRGAEVLVILFQPVNPVVFYQLVWLAVTLVRFINNAIMIQTESVVLSFASKDP